jgi:hypothetical protein
LPTSGSFDIFSFSLSLLFLMFFFFLFQFSSLFRLLSRVPLFLFFYIWIILNSIHSSSLFFIPLHSFMMILAISTQINWIPFTLLALLWNELHWIQSSVLPFYISIINCHSSIPFVNDRQLMIVINN